MPAWVYILKSTRNSSYYIGSTRDITNRLQHHNSGATPYTRNNGPFILVFSQQYPTLKSAQFIERWLKKSKSKALLETIVAEQIIKKSGRALRWTSEGS